MTRKIQFARELAFPIDAVTQKIALLGRSGVGKTYAGTKLAEGMLDAGVQTVVLDPTGVWWGLRIAASGKAPGIQIPIFGGDHGDLELNSRSGALIARTIVEKEISAVLDVSAMTGGEMKAFVADFAVALLAEKRKKRSPIHVFWEECQDFVPQKVYGDSARMVGAVERLIKQGRNFGIGTTLISQRPQAVNKDVLSQTEILCVLQINEAHARKAIESWIVDQGLNITDLVETLPGLEKGEAWVWSPQFLRVTKRVHVAKKWTYDASSTPKFGKAAFRMRQLAPKDLKELSAALASMPERIDVKQGSDKAQVDGLKAHVTSLEKQLVEVRASKIKRVEVNVLKPKDLNRLERLIAKGEKLGAANTETAALLSKALTACAQAVLSTRPSAVPLAPVLPPNAAKPGVMAHVLLARGRTEAAHWKPIEVQAGPEQIKKGARKMLEALRDLGGPLTRDQIATMVGLPARGTTFQAYLGTLKRGGYVVESNDGIRLASNAFALLPIGEGSGKPLTTESLLQIWSPKLKAGARAMLETLVRCYPASISREDLGKTVDLPHTGTTFQAYLGILIRSGLAQRDVGAVRASATLFP